MSLRWRRRTRGRKHSGDAVIGALREEAQTILAWRRRLPTDMREHALGIIVDLLTMAAARKIKLEGSSEERGSRHLRFYATWQDDEQSTSLYVSAAGVRSEQWKAWELSVEVHRSATRFVLAALREEQTKP